MAITANVTNPALHWATARAVSACLAPAPVATALLLCAGLRGAANPVDGLRLGALAIACAVLAPHLFMEYALRRTRPSGPRNFRRTERYVPLAIATVCVSATLAFVGKSGDARNLMDCLHAMAFVLAAALVATLAGKVSIHSAAMAGGVIIVGQLFGPVCVTLLPLVVLVGWSRVVLGAHTPQQVLAGVLVGIAGSIQAYGMSP